MPAEEYEADLGEAVPIEDGSGNPLGTVTAPPLAPSIVATSGRGREARDEYQRLVARAREHHRPEPPPFPDR